MGVKTMNNKIKAAVIGVGYLGKHHARIYNELDKSSLVAVADIIEDRALEIANKYGCTPYIDYREMLEKETIDVVSIAVPTSLHYEVAKECLLRGISVLLEKPISTKLEHADELFRISKEKGVVFQVGYVERFNPIVSYLPKYINSPYLIMTKRLCPFVNRNLDIGVVLDLMIHDIDIVLSIVKEEIEEIGGKGITMVSPHEDIASAYLKFKSGCRAHFVVSRVSPTPARKLEIIDEKRRIILDYTKKELLLKDLNGLQSLEHIKLINPEEPLKNEIAFFLDNVINGRNPKEDGRLSFHVALKILESMEREKNV